MLEGINDLTQVSHFPQDLTGFRPTEGRVWSLWELMNRFDALAIAASVSSLHGLACGCRKQEIISGKKGVAAGAERISMADAILKGVAMWGISYGMKRASACARTAQRYIAAEKDVTSMRAQLMNVVNAIMDDLTKRTFLGVTEQRSLVDRDDLFGAEVLAAFPNARDDIKAVGNCMAAECNTAAVFHMMRAVEWGLRSLCAHLGVKSVRCRNKKTGKVTYKPISYQQWETILGQLQARVEKRIGKLRAGPVKQKWQEFYFPAIQDLNAFREAFRNHVMHARREYSAAEADATRDRVERFMRLLATRVSEV